MLSVLRRWFSSSPRAAATTDIEPWAQQRGLSVRRVRDREGFVIDGRIEGVAWRAEWGASTRSYIVGNELRLIGELGVHRDVQCLVLNRALVEALEKSVFDQFVEGVQTRIDTEVPAEARWLVMFPKLAGAEMRALRERWVALASVKPWLLRWLEGPLTESLAATAQRTDATTPVVLALARGRLTLRTGMAEATAAGLAEWLGLFEVALREARRVMQELPEVPAASRTVAVPTEWGNTSFNTPTDFGAPPP